LKRKKKKKRRPGLTAILVSRKREGGELNPSGWKEGAERTFRSVASASSFSEGGGEGRGGGGAVLNSTFFLEQRKEKGRGRNR